MKKVLISILLVIACSISANAFEKDGVYYCTYELDKYTTANSVFITDNNGEISSTMCSTDSPSLRVLNNQGKCTFTPNTNYTCKYPQGSCNVKIMAKDGHEVSCAGETPETAEVLEAAKNGKCSKQ